MTRDLWRTTPRIGWILVLLTVLLLSGSVGAQEPSPRSDERLVEGATELQRTHKIACGSKFCVWSVTDEIALRVKEGKVEQLPSAR